ncbi:MAG: NAD(P)H-hydrate dehydratase [Gammaproteobacteria bacterium]
MNELPAQIYSAAQVRELDRIAIEEAGIPGYTLMKRAGRAAFDALRERWPLADRLLILCGGGNNAGDAYVVARCGLEAGLDVVTAALAATDRLRGDAATARADFSAIGGNSVPWRTALLDGRDLIVDGLLGTGLERPLEGDYRAVVDSVNRAGLPVFALDLPTGMHADTGVELGAALRADATMSFVGLKLGCFLGAGPDCTGTLLFDDLGVPAGLYPRLSCPLERLTQSWLSETLRPRRRGTHKGEQGHALVIGGGPGMGGAIRLTAEGALRAGAGLVTVATAPGNARNVTTVRPELMARDIEEAAQLDELFERADIVAIGPGLGKAAWGRSLWQAALVSGLPLVADADALNLLAEAPVERRNWVLTPHPGEAGRLLGSSGANVQSDRLQSVRDLAQRYGGVAVLKGAFTLIAENQGVAVCDRGNPGMAAPGMGDVLTGVIAGLGACGRPLIDAARAGVLVHALAGDDAARAGERGTVAGDLFAHVRRRVNPSPDR